jgi:hypothetical protein
MVRLESHIGSQKDISYTEREVCRVMKAKGMRYRKVKHIPIGANIVRNLVLRQRWTMTVLEKDHRQKIYLNIDETWLGMSDFRRMKW